MGKVLEDGSADGEVARRPARLGSKTLRVSKTDWIGWEIVRFKAMEIGWIRSLPSSSPVWSRAGSKEMVKTLIVNDHESTFANSLDNWNHQKRLQKINHLQKQSWNLEF